MRRSATWRNVCDAASGKGETEIGDIEAPDMSNRDRNADADGRTTIVDVARAAGVSKSTVSLVLAGSSLVARSTRDRVSEAMAELGYIYHRGAATLRGAKSDVIGMVINDLSNPFFVELAIGIEEACQTGAFIPFLANSVESPERQLQVVRSMREHGAAGLVLSPAIGTSVAELRALVAGMPVVQVMRRLPGLKASLVAPENQEGARKATAHLIGLGHKRIAFAGGLPSMVVRDERLSGYRLALQEAGIAADESLVVASAINYSGAAAVAPQLLSAAATAALCFNDVVAIGLIRAFAAKGVVVGKNFGVIGFDDIDEAKHAYPALTSVAVNGRNLGARAAQLLMRHLASGIFEPEALLCPTTLVVRSSCGAAAL
jgi:LacI family transcriptional regulator